MGLLVLKPGEVSFMCDTTFSAETKFTLKGDGRRFVVLSGLNRKHQARPQ
jgi:hypothetical protein